MGTKKSTFCCFGYGTVGTELRSPWSLCCPMFSSWFCFQSPGELCAEPGSTPRGGNPLPGTVKQDNCLVWAASTARASQQWSFVSSVQQQGKQRLSEVAVFILLQASRPGQLIAIVFMISRGQMNKEKQILFYRLVGFFVST